MTRVADQDRPLWGVATRRGLRRAIRETIARVQPARYASLTKPHRSDGGRTRLEAVPQVQAGREELSVQAASSVDSETNERHEQHKPAVAGRECTL